ncbi:MAG TPA: SDR family oxidoreductase [Terriglobales bacterium]
MVTGASGLLGSSLVREALARGRQVSGICRQNSLPLPGADVYSVDLTNSVATQELVHALHPSIILHCAAATNVDWCEDHPEEARMINVAASAFLSKLAREMDATFVYVSSDGVFDGHRGNYSESDAPNPLNAYAASKCEAEREVLAADPSALIVRVTFYGWNPQQKSSLAGWILSELNHGTAVRGFTDVFFCPLLANDLSGILVDMLDRQLYGVYHVVGSERVSKFDFAVRLAAVFGFDPTLVIPSSIMDAELRAPRPRDTSLSTQKISQALGRAMPDVDSGLRRFRALRNGAGARLQSCIAGGNA